jgi:DNA-binding response OmpR family regulator
VRIIITQTKQNKVEYSVARNVPAQLSLSVFSIQLHRMSMPHRILIVDDEDSIRSALTLLLAQAGYETRSAGSGNEALSIFASDRDGIDLLILDIVMPGTNGYDVCLKVRQAARYIPIIMLTARSLSIDKLHGLEVGADIYITKPFNSQELLAQVNALFRLVEQSNNSADAVEIPLVCGGVKLWECQHRVEVDGCAVELTPKEFELLRLFLCNPGKVFGRETLLRAIWGYESSVDTRTVNVNVQRLRAKIEHEPSIPCLICTVRGFGYRLTLPSGHDHP